MPARSDVSDSLRLLNCLFSAERASPASAGTRILRFRFRFAYHRHVCHLFALLVFTFIVTMNASAAVCGVQDQGYNPNNFDTGKIMNAIINPHRDLVTLASHRGLHALVDGSYPGVPENSLQAVGLTAQSGCEIIELDIKLTSDGVPILSHDTTWGRETLYRSSAGDNVNFFNPFGPYNPTDPSNDAQNPSVNSLTSAHIQNTNPSENLIIYLRDSISLGRLISREVPSSLQNVLDYMKSNKIAMVISLDMRDVNTAEAAWQVIANNTDYLGRPYAASTLIKLPAGSFPTTSAFKTAFSYGPGYQSVKYIPVYNTSDIAPGTENDNLFGGTDVGVGESGFGNEQNMISQLSAFQQDPTITIAAVEVNLKQSGGILTSFLTAARTNSRTGQPVSVGIFSPYVDYYAPSDTSQTNPLFFRTNGYCCLSLSASYYNGAPNGQPSDTADYRGSFSFVAGQRFGSVTADNVATNASLFDSIGARNISYMQASGIKPNTTQLTVLPLGDSITWGYENPAGTDAGNGYRAYLQTELIGEGYTVNYVGSQTSGNLADPENEGHPGYRIDQIAALTNASLAQYLPNVVLLLAGTNDMNQSYEVATAPARLGALIDQIVAAAPNATLLVGSLPPNADPTVEANIAAFNAQVPAVVQARSAAGKNVVFVDLGSRLTTADLSDGLHPNDAGYKLIADAWNGTLYDISLANLVQAAVPCASTPAGCSGGSGGSGGSGHTPGPLGPAPGPGSWADQGEVASGIGVDGSTVQFADINGDGKADYLSVDPASGGVTAYFNGGRAADGHMIWYPQGHLASGVAPGAQIQFADINGDGRADYLIVDPASGALSAYLNGGPNPNGGWIWYPQGQLASGVAPGAQIQFADINGDGRADYLIVDPTSGALSAYFNGGRAADGHMIWYPQGQLASGVGAPKGSKVLFGDINADGYADYLVISADDGSVHAWLNQGPISGGWDWVPQGQIAPGNGIAAARFYVHEADIDGDGRVDYITVASDSSVHVWLNKGNDKTRVAPWLPLGAIASGISDSSSTVYLKDLDGDGRADYISINQTTGVAKAYINGGANPSGGWIWYPLSSPLASGVGAPQGAIYQFGDINGDGKTDYLVVEPVTGRTDAWVNGGKGTNGSWIWYPYGNVYAGASLSDFPGLKSVGAAVLFADVSGDGLEDWIVLNTATGDAWATLNQGAAAGYFTSNKISAIAYATGLGGNVTFAKLNYDTQADYIAANNLGNVYGFLNGGFKADNSISWLSQGEIASGVAAPGPTTAITFADLNGDGRADYIVMNTTNGAITQAWLNNGGGLPMWDEQ